VREKVPEHIDQDKSEGLVGKTTGLVLQKGAEMIGPFKGKYRFLSNFWPCEIVFEGLKFPSSEHAYQAAKTFDDTIRKQIASAATPGKAKRAGQQVELRPDWEAEKIGIMLEILRQKFSIPKLASLLLATGDENLVEVNHWGDTFWGVCQGKGENHLGRLLMNPGGD